MGNTLGLRELLNFQLSVLPQTQNSRRLILPPLHRFVQRGAACWAFLSRTDFRLWPAGARAQASARRAARGSAPRSEPRGPARGTFLTRALPNPQCCGLGIPPCDIENGVLSAPTKNQGRSTRDLAQGRSFLLPLKDNVSEIQEVKENSFWGWEAVISGKGLDRKTGAKNENFCSRLLK